MASASCNPSREDIDTPIPPEATLPDDDDGGETTPKTSPASIGIVGSKDDVTTETEFGYVIMGGNYDVDNALRWMIDRSGGGDVVVIRVTGEDAYNDYIYDLGTVNSVETLKIDSRDLANDPDVEQTIRNAEMLFIAGGDQADYVNLWRGTKTNDAINYLINDKKVPVGGTSAGAAILGGAYFSAISGGVTSEEALNNPFYNRITINQNDFIRAPYMEHIITDQHFSQRDRQGRLMTFLARIISDGNDAPQGIAVDEDTAVAIDEEGKAVVFGQNSAYFLKTDLSKKPETLQSNEKLVWSHGNEAVEVYIIEGSRFGSGMFDVKTFDESSADGGVKQWWWVDSGTFRSQAR